MNTKARIQKLESVRRVSTYGRRAFMRIVRPDNNRFSIDGVQVTESTYKKEHAEYVKVHKNSGIPDEIIIRVERGER
jgi:hypothetical protein